MTDLVYRSGTAPTAVHGTDVVMVISDEASALGLWEIVSSEGWSNTQVLEVLTVGGLSSAPDFCAVMIRGSRATILVRGGCSATVTSAVGSEHLDGRLVSTWVERSVEWTDETMVELAAGDVVGDVDLPVGSGVVMAGSVRVGRQADVPADAPGVIEQDLGDPGDLVGPANDEVAADVSVVQLSDDAPTGIAAPPVVAPEPAVVEVLPAGVTPPEVVDEPEEPHIPIVDPGATLADVEESSFDAMFGATVPGRRLEDAAVREVPVDESSVVDVPSAAPGPPSVVAAPVAGDHDGRTMSSAELARLKSQVTPGSTAIEPVVVPRISATLDFSTGRSIDLDRPVVIGRSPRAHGSTSSEMPQLVVVDNPYISGTHLLAAVDDGVVLVTDLSTNGTLIKPPGEDSRRLDKGRETVVVDGSILNLSDDVTVTVTVTGAK